MEAAGRSAEKRQIDELGLERSLATRLDGVRLVCEINITEDLYADAAASIGALVRYRADYERMVRLYPATFVVYLVAEGLRRWDGTYWDNLRVRLNPQEAGPAFVRCLESLRLPVFEEETREGFRYVSKILLHAGIPQYCAADVLRLIARTLETTPGDGADLLAKWRRTTSDFQSLDRPAQRFLLYGGTDSIALIDRIIEMFRRSALGQSDGLADIGLPDYLVQEYEQLPNAMKRSGKGLVRPRPRLELAAGGGGPVIVLPPHPQASGMEWLVDTGDRNIARLGSTTDPQIVPVEPYGKWRVTLKDRTRQYQFDLDANRATPVVFFDGNSRAWIRTPDRVSEGAVLALAPSRYNFRLDGPDGRSAPTGHEQPPLDGRWSRHMVQELVLRAGQRLWFGDPQDQDAPTGKVLVTRPPLAPRVDGQTLAGVWAEGSVPVFLGAPEISVDELMTKPAAYTVRITSLSSQATMTRPLNLLERGSVGFKVPEVGPEPGLYDLDVLGPLGCELRRFRFGTVPGGSSSNVPPYLVSPEAVVHVAVTISGVERTASLPAGQTSAQLAPIDPGLPLRAEIARLTWGVSRRGLASPFGIEPAALATPDLRAEENLQLLVHAAEGSSVTLGLVADGRTLQSVTNHVKGEGGLVSFPLAGFGDTAAAAEQGRLQFEIVVTGGEEPIHAVVATVLANFEVADLRVEWSPEDHGILTACWSERRVFPDRAVMLWSAAVADAAPLVFQVPDSARGQYSWTVVADPETYGAYFASIAIHDGWDVPVRPESLVGTSYVELGKSGGDDLAVRAVDGSNTGELAACVWRFQAPSGGEIPLSAAAVWLANLVARFGADAVDMGDAKMLREVLFDDPDAGTLAILEMARAWPHSRRDLQALALLLTDDGLTVPAKALTISQWLDLGVEMPLVWASMRVGASADEWRRVTGWSPEGQTPPPAGTSVRLSFLEWTQESIEGSIAKLWENTLGSDREPARALSWGRQQLGIFTWLLTQNPAHGQTIRWQSRSGSFHDPALKKMLPPVARSLDQLRPSERLNLENPRARITQFPSDLLAAAVHLVLGTPRRIDALKALIEASRYAPMLAERAVMSALAMVRLQSGGQ